MKTLILIVSMVVCNSLFALEQPDMNYNNIEIKGAESELAKLVIKENTLNFGEVNFGEEYTHYFEIENKGNAPLLIEDAFAGNKNSEVYSFSPEIKPSESGWVRVRFESKNDIGKFSEFFFVRSNSGGKKTLTRLKVDYELFEYLAIGGDNVEANDKINIRERPLLDSPIIYQLERGESCKIVGDDIGDYVEKFDDSFWFKVENEGRVGWVLSALTEF